MKVQDDTAYIRALISEGEHVRQDFKFEISDSRKIARSLSAFANTEGGRLLIGVKDNGRIAGVRSEEEMYMVEAAAQVYCTPAVEVDMRVYRPEGRSVLVASVGPAVRKPVLVKEENGRRLAYVRIADENILASPVHIGLWKCESDDDRNGSADRVPVGNVRMACRSRSRFRRYLPSAGPVWLTCSQYLFWRFRPRPFLGFSLWPDSVADMPPRDHPPPPGRTPALAFRSLGPGRHQSRQPRLFLLWQRLNL